MRSSYRVVDLVDRALIYMTPQAWTSADATSCKTFSTTAIPHRHYDKYDIRLRVEVTSGESNMFTKMAFVLKGI